MELAYRGEKRPGMQTRAPKRSSKRLLARLHLPSPSWTVPGPRIEDFRLGCWSSCGLTGVWPVLEKPCIPRREREWGSGAGMSG